MIGLIVTACLAVLILPLRVAGPTATAQGTVPRPGPKDLCPVCGMIVSKYPNWICTVVWKDGRVDYFDGAKDMFKFLQALPEYAPGRSVGAVASMTVTDFYDLKTIDARTAVYVIGSDVLGPMGRELVPLANAADAADFMKDHRGAQALRFAEVTPAVVAKIDSGKGGQRFGRHVSDTPNLGHRVMPQPTDAELNRKGPRCHEVRAAERRHKSSIGAVHLTAKCSRAILALEWQVNRRTTSSSSRAPSTSSSCAPCRRWVPSTPTCWPRASSRSPSRRCV